MIHLFKQPIGAYPDAEGVEGSPYPITTEEAHQLNAKGYAIGFYPNSGGRTNKSIKQINAWFVDIDYKHAKPSVDDLLQLSPLVPSWIVESKNGYHIYFVARNAAPGDDYVKQQEALIEFFSGDMKCKNMARFMRMPGFKHMKDPSAPYDVQIIYQSKAVYTKEQMKYVFAWPEEEESEQKQDISAASTNVSHTENLFDKIRHYDSKIILGCLSGSSAVGGKRYRLKPKGKGHYNIIVDGKDSGCFVNDKGNIIASAGHSGGATEWLTWYGLSRNAALAAIKGVMGWE